MNTGGEAMLDLNHDSLSPDPDFSPDHDVRLGDAEVWSYWTEGMTEVGKGVGEEYEGTPVVGVDEGWQVVGQDMHDSYQHFPVPTDDQMMDLPNFDPAHAGADVIGDPGDDMTHWHVQTYTDTCAVVTQEYILESVTGQDFSEDALRQEAIANGWYTPGGGTPLEHVGDLLEAHGVGVERTSGATLEDLATSLSQGEKVIVAVDADEIWSPGQSLMRDDFLEDLTGIPGQDANHAVEVIGIDNSDPDHSMVVLNDPGHPDGRGAMVPADEFVNAWTDSGCFMVHTTGQNVSEVRLGYGNYDSNGDWHWSDGTPDSHWKWEGGSSSTYK
jgi:hypothetical protein